MQNNIRDLRVAKGMTMRELADRLGETHFTTIGKIERSTKPLSLEWVVKLAGALGVSPSEIKGGPSSGISAVRAIPVIGMVAAGSWREAIQTADEFIQAPVEGANLFALRVQGNSMDKIAPDGSSVIVDPDDFELRDGAFYVIMNGDGETTFKQYRASPPRLEPLSSDDSHKTMLLGREHFTVVGRVAGQITLFR